MSYKKKKYKGLLILALALTFAMAATFFMVTQSKDNLKSANKILQQTKKKQKKKKQMSEKTALQAIIKELEKNKNKYNLQSKAKKDIEKIAREYLKRRYNYKGKSSDKAKNITDSLKDFCDEAFIDTLSEKISTTAAGNGGMAERDNHTCYVKSVYITQVKEADNASDNSKQNELTYICDVYADTIINDIPSISHLTMRSTQNNDWIILDEDIIGQKFEATKI